MTDQIAKGKGKGREERAATQSLWNRVNVVAWAKEMLDTDMWQNVADTKGFTGKGIGPELRGLLGAIDTCEHEMLQLSAATKQVGGAHMYLALHRRTQDGYVALRWRGVKTRKHLSWEEAADYVEQLSSKVRSWYERVNAQAVGLNQHHINLRKKVRELKTQAQRRSPHIFARQIPTEVSVSNK
ncbi:hypothetical protein [Comamonas jiangduensis]|uniref:hypothetical protein n=1 Tax=Comamonas jiangduensis TaxID=1194168 RepID=UPI003BF900C3